jgi:hypothetical protein
MRRIGVLTLALAAGLIATPARAADPGRWRETGTTTLPIVYYQGVTVDPARNLYFDGVFVGLYRTDSGFNETGRVDDVIPPDVHLGEGYNHIGDLSWDPGEGGRILLPLECYVPGGPNGGNPCLHGSIGVADPATLQWRYYVKLDPAEIAKAMWIESSPDGRLLWTSSGADLLGYRAAEVTPARAAPVGAPLRAVRRLGGAVPPSGVTGAAFRRGRLFLAGAVGTTYQIWSVDVRSGSRRLEVELANVQGEAEGLHAMRLMNGELHWLVAPLAARPSFPPSVALLHFTRARGRAGLRLTARATAAQTKRPRISVRVLRRSRPVAGAVVTLADARRRTDRGGRVTLMPRLAVPGNYAALARKDGLRGMTKRFRLGFDDPPR